MLNNYQINHSLSPLYTVSQFYKKVVSVTNFVNSTVSYSNKQKNTNNKKLRNSNI